MAVEVTRAIWMGVVFGVAVGGTALGVSTGCSSSSAATTASASHASACPATIDDTVGKPCSAPGIVCGPTYACGPTQVPITCTCFDGTFQCIDGAGKPFDGTVAPTCPTHNPASGACPADENTASGAACTSTQVGQQCAYQAKCTGGTQAFDVCTCTEGMTQTGGQGLVFICENSCSGGAGPVPDAGKPTPDASSSGGGDTGAPDAPGG